MISEQAVVVHAEGLGKQYGASRVVDNVSLRVHRSSIFGLLGPNGAGKTTIVKMLTGLTRPTSGTIRIAGHRMTGAAVNAKRALGHVYSNMAFYRHLNAVENLRFFGGFYRLGAGRLAERIADTLEFVDLWQERKKRVGAYSSGMRQRLGIAKALLHDPAVLLFDEATNGLDIEGRDDICELMFELRVRGKTSLVTSHRLDEIELLCDEIGILDKGKLIEQGSPSEIQGSLDGVLFKYVVRTDQPIDVEDVPGIASVRFLGQRNVVLSGQPLRDVLGQRFGADSVEEVRPTFEEACLWILRHRPNPQ